jgi:hypothetical protein
MAKQDDWVRITLRLPPELHEMLVGQAGAGSLNAEIVERLIKSVEQEVFRDRTPRETVHIKLDTQGRPISWAEIHAHLQAISEALDGYNDLRMEVITPEHLSSRGREAEAEALREAYKKWDAELHVETPTIFNRPKKA